MEIVNNTIDCIKRGQGRCRQCNMRRRITTSIAECAPKKWVSEVMRKTKLADWEKKIGVEFAGRSTFWGF